MPQELISVFRHWYARQDNQVRWAGIYSDTYRLECGVRQGGRSSPKLFSLYVNELIEGLSSMHAGCSIDNQMVNNISYADDMVLLSPSVCALRDLLRVCEDYAEKHGLKYNVKKSMLMVFAAGSISPSYVPPVRLYGAELVRVPKCTYLGHVVTADMKDNCDIDRERRALAVRGNMIARRFARCTKEVKVTLFKSFCQSFYTCSLWVDYTQKSINALRVQYNNIFRIMLGLPRYCSASGMFADNCVDGFFAIIRKRIASMKSRLERSPNIILKVIADRQDSALKAHWMSALVNKYINYIN
ncbi:uncharacterized protein [Maniola hyperantus]|uniref:uncharacterized protein n=1 Tax=Aphantopus hyperantus TaxID=2795564 RepID=UPI00374879B6